MQSAAETAADKRLATLRARAALAGVTVHVSDNDAGRVEYVVSHQAWALTKALASLNDLEHWLDRVGAPG
jgi:hypothetical protein